MQNRNNKIIILIPIFCENSALLESIEFWKKSKYKPIFITTEREKEYFCKSIKILEKSGCSFINSPNKIGFKASQLNYVISKINSDGYISIFDVDSRPDLEVFEYVEKSASDEVLQMPTLFIENFNTTSYYGKASAIYQSRRVLTYEIPALLNKKFTYLVGHGLFIKNSIFQKTVFCEKTLTEDLVFGYQIYFSGIRPIPLAYFDYSTVPSKFLPTIAQTSRWFSGDLFFIKYVEISKIYSFDILRRYFHIFDWLFGSISIIFILLFGDVFQFGLTIILIALYIYIHILTMKFIKIKKNPQIMIFLIFKFITNSIPAIYGLFRLMLHFLKIKNYVFERTEK